MPGLTGRCRNQTDHSLGLPWIYTLLSDGVESPGLAVQVAFKSSRQRHSINFFSRELLLDVNGKELFFLLFYNFLFFCFQFSDKQSHRNRIMSFSAVSGKANFLAFYCHTAVTQETHLPIAFATMLTLFSSFDELYSSMSALT